MERTEQGRPVKNSQNQNQIPTIENYIQTTIRIPESLWRKFSATCDSKMGYGMKAEVINALVRAWVEANPLEEVKKK